MDKLTKIVAQILFGLIIIVLTVQTLSLFVNPFPDSLRWWGDESWRMLEARDLLRYDQPIIPEAVGSTLSRNVGLVGASSWIGSLLYGIPLVLFGNSFNLIFIGRIISLLIAIATLALLWKLLSKLSISKPIALLVLLPAILTNAFLAGSHSARSDMIASYGITLFLYLSIRLVDRANELTPRDYFIFGLVWASGPLLYLHVMSLTAIAFVYACFRTKVWQTKRGSAALIFGCVSGAALILLPYVLLTHSLSLLGSNGSAVQYNGVIGDLPILHLNSPALIAHLNLARVRQWLYNTMPLAVLVLAGIVCFLVARSRRNPSSKSPLWQSAITIALLILLSACFFQGPAMFYVVHLLPAFVILAGVGIQSIIEKLGPRLSKCVLVALTIAAIITTGFNLRRETRMARANAEVVQNDKTAIDSLISNATHSIQSGPKPRILTDQATTWPLLIDQRIQLITWHFLYFPISDHSKDSMLSQGHVDFLLVSNKQRELVEYAESHDSLSAFVAGTLFEHGIAPVKPNQDTFFLYLPRAK